MTAQQIASVRAAAIVNARLYVIGKSDHWDNENEAFNAASDCFGIDWRDAVNSRRLVHLIENVADMYIERHASFSA